MDEARLFDTFEQLLAISAPSGQEEPVRHLLEERLSALGFACRRDARGNLLGARPGAGAPALLCAHMDTVPLAAGARVVSDAQGYRSDGSTALGADDRAGIAVILEALASQSARSAEVLFTVEEERALAGSRAADLGGFAARQALIPDSSLDVGALVLQTPTKARLSVEVLGRAGVPFAAARSMGGSDGNSLAGAGIVPLVMGTGAKCPHAVEERISRASLQSAALVAEYYLKEEV